MPKPSEYFLNFFNDAPAGTDSLVVAPQVPVFQPAPVAATPTFQIPPGYVLVPAHQAAPPVAREPAPPQVSAVESAALAAIKKQEEKINALLAVQEAETKRRVDMYRSAKVQELTAAGHFVRSLPGKTEAEIDAAIPAAIAQSEEAKAFYASQVPVPPTATVAAPPPAAAPPAADAISAPSMVAANPPVAAENLPSNFTEADIRYLTSTQGMRSGDYAKHRAQLFQKIREQAPAPSRFMGPSPTVFGPPTTPVAQFQAAPLGAQPAAPGQQPAPQASYGEAVNHAQAQQIFSQFDNMNLTEALRSSTPVPVAEARNRAFQSLQSRRR